VEEGGLISQILQYDKISVNFTRKAPSRLSTGLSLTASQIRRSNVTGKFHSKLKHTHWMGERVICVCVCVCACVGEEGGGLIAQASSKTRVDNINSLLVLNSFLSRKIRCGKTERGVGVVDITTGFKVIRVTEVMCIRAHSIQLKQISHCIALTRSHLLHSLSGTT
jgi:hypothetical protein